MDNKIIIDGVDVSECEHYRAKINELIDQNFKIAQKYTKLEQENERLKDKVYTLQGAFDFQVRSNGKINEFRIKYRQALQEIRELVEKEIVCDDCNFEGTDKCDARMCTHFYLNDFSKDILDKINEVIGAEE